MKKKNIVKTLKYILWAFLATVATAACTEEPDYISGAGEDPDNYGVYFPTQTSATEVELDPSETPEVTYRVRRTRYVDAITVPVTVEASAEDIFEIDPIFFGPGEQETEFTVSFPDAEVGVEYTCNIRIEDPHYIEVYGKRSTSLSFSVIRAGWVPYPDAGEGAKAKWRDNIISNMYSLSSSSFNPYPEVESELYQREDIKGYYRMKVYGSDFMTALAGSSSVSYESRNVWTVIDARDPNRVYIPYQSTGLTLLSADGEIYIASNVPENFSMDESAAQYGTLEDGVITFPAQSIMIEQESNPGTFYYGNREGMLRILLPGVEEKDYTVTLSSTEPSDGKVDITATFASDARSLKYSFFEGALDDGTASLQAQEMDAAQDFDAVLEAPAEGASGVIKVESMEGGTGIYTLVGCVYDDESTMRGYVYTTFGYVTAGEERPVILNIGLEATNEYAGQGITPDNSAKFFAYGEGIESASYGLFRSDRIDGADLNEVLDVQGTAFTDEQLADINGGHFSRMLTGLNGDSEYTLVMRAFNGYVTSVVTATIRTTGEYNPGKEVFYYEDFVPSNEQPTVNELISTDWNYYAIDLMGESIERRKIGQVNMTQNTELSTSSLTLLNIEGLSGLDFEEGGVMLGGYMPNSGTFTGYNGAIALYVQEDMTSGVYNGENVILGFIPLENTYIYSQGYCMFIGEVYDGYLYCVSSPAASGQGLTFSYLFTGSAGTPYSLMTEMMLVDPEKDKGGLPGAAVEKIASMRRQAMQGFTPRNFVELPQYSGTGVSGQKDRIPVNLVNNPVPASAPSVRKAGATVSTSALHYNAGSGEIHGTGVRAGSRERVM